MSELLRWCVVGVGNVFRKDDAVGLMVSRRLRANHPHGCKILEAGGEGGALMELWRGAERVIVVDAVASQAPPGTVRRFDVSAAPLPVEWFHSSSHAFSVAQAVEMARVLGCLPLSLIIYGIEGADFSDGVGLSPDVEHAVEVACQQIAREIGDA